MVTLGIISSEQVGIARDVRLERGGDCGKDGSQAKVYCYNCYNFAGRGISADIHCSLQDVETVKQEELVKNMDTSGK